MPSALRPLLASVLLALPATGAEHPPSPESLRAAVAKSLTLLTSSADVSAERKTCFTCHHQGLPVVTATEAHSRGFTPDPLWLQRQSKHTAAHLHRGIKNYLTGSGQGGKADTAGSALWTLESAAYPGDATTTAVVDFLLRWNADTPHWSPQSDRPPSEGSRFTSTYLALRGLAAFATDTHHAAVEKRRTAARAWLIATPPTSTEDHVFRLHALAFTGADPRHIAAATTGLQSLQNPDGGWPQLHKGTSDAYSTGSALVALHDSGGIKADSPDYLRGLRFLLASQRSGGSWHVVTRSRPVQEHYESGFPHGKDQFISATGTAWATRALLRALPATKP